MTNKNPYENEVDIPDFVEKNDNDVDMSVFKMAQNEADPSEINYDEDDEDYDDEPRKKLSLKGLIIIGGVICVVLLILAIAGWIFGISKNNALKKLQGEYDQIEIKLNQTTSDYQSLQAENMTLKEENEKLKTSGGGSSTSGDGEQQAEGTKYKLEGDVGVRKGAGANNDYVNFDNLPDTVQDIVTYDKDSGKVTTRQDAIFPVYETKKDSAGNTWGRVADNAWVCLEYNGETWGIKQ